MERLVVDGPCRLSGCVRVHGAKNAILPILAATVINGKESVIHDCPALADVEESLKILRFLGCETRRSGTDVYVDSENLTATSIPEHLMLKMRSSVIFLGAIAARQKRAQISLPGGCEIGPRPIDLHLKAFLQMGMEIDESGGIINCDAKNMHADDIHLDFPSVGATENIMLAASRLPGVTSISNAAKEPEIEDLARFLQGMGVTVEGAGSSVIKIHGTDKLKSVEHTVMPDRIVAATYMCAAMLTGGHIRIKNVCPDHMQAMIAAMREAGAGLYISKDTIEIAAPARPKAIKRIRTYPYPGFPTDMQSVLMSVLALSDGTSVVTENIFANRFKHVDGLVRMGADITIDGQTAIVRGKDRLTGAHVEATDLRGGAALVIAALAAEGESVIDRVEYIDRGYVRFEDELRNLGARIRRA